MANELVDRFGKRLRIARKACELELAAAAKLARLSAADWLQWEAGKGEPDIDQLLEIHKLLNPDFNWLVGYQGESAMAKRKAQSKEVSPEVRLQEQGERLREAREARGISIAKAARLSGVGESEWESWECGEEEPHYLRIRRVAHVLGVEWLWLEEGKGKRDDASAFGRLLKEARLRYKLSIPEAAGACGVETSDEWEQWEAGRDIPPFFVVVEIVENFDLSLRRLSGYPDPPRENREPDKQVRAAIVARGKRICEARERRKLTIEQAAKRCGFTTQEWEWWELGIGEPLVSELTIISKQLRADLGTLVGGVYPSQAVA